MALQWVSPNSLRLGVDIKRFSSETSPDSNDFWLFCFRLFSTFVLRVIGRIPRFALSSLRVRLARVHTMPNPPDVFPTPQFRDRSTLNCGTVGEHLLLLLAYLVHLAIFRHFAI